VAGRRAVGSPPRRVDWRGGTGTRRRRPALRRLGGGAPLRHLGGGAENDYFSEGITDEIISELARLEGLKVISHTSVAALEGGRLTLPQIAHTLGVRHVLEGSVVATPAPLPSRSLCNPR
jgi:hypothetical protein